VARRNAARAAQLKRKEESWGLAKTNGALMVKMNAVREGGDATKKHADQTTRVTCLRIHIPNNMPYFDTFQKLVSCGVFFLCVT
jgi:hypothetical protein